MLTNLQCQWHKGKVEVMSIPVFSHVFLLSVSRWKKLNCSSFPVRVVLILLLIFSLHYPVCFWKLLFHPQLHVILPLFGTEWRLFLLGFNFHFKALLQQCSLWEEGLLWFPCEPAHWFGQVNSPTNGTVCCSFRKPCRARTVHGQCSELLLGAGGKSSACCSFPISVVFLNFSRWLCSAVLR